jgi:HEAT repeat protein
MATAEIVLDYIQTLVWPALIVFVVLRFRRGIADFMRRIAGESREFSASAFGVGITAKFQEQLANLAEQSKTADPEQLRESVKRAAHDFGLDQFRALTSNFADLSLDARREAAETLAEIAETMELDDLVSFADSGNGGERTGAAIGLGVQLQRDPSAARRDPKILEAVRKLLRDRSSLVRYRAVEAVRAVPELAADVEDELRSLAENDRNRHVRTMALKALARRWASVIVALRGHSFSLATHAMLQHKT